MPSEARLVVKFLSTGLDLGYACMWKKNRREETEGLGIGGGVWGGACCQAADILKP